MSYNFEKTGGDEQSYSIIEGADFDEFHSMIANAEENAIDLVAIMDAECQLVFISSRRVAKLILPWLNSDQEPLKSLGNIEETES